MPSIFPRRKQSAPSIASRDTLESDATSFSSRKRHRSASTRSSTTVLRRLRKFFCRRGRRELSAIGEVTTEKIHIPRTNFFSLPFEVRDEIYFLVALHTVLRLESPAVVDRAILNAPWRAVSSRYTSKELRHHAELVAAINRKRNVDRKRVPGLLLASHRTHSEFQRPLFSYAQIEAAVHGFYFGHITGATSRLPEYALKGLRKNRRLFIYMGVPMPAPPKCIQVSLGFNLLDWVLHQATDSQKIPWKYRTVRNDPLNRWLMPMWLGKLVETRYLREYFQVPAPLWARENKAASDELTAIVQAFGFKDMNHIGRIRTIWRPAPGRHEMGNRDTGYLTFRVGHAL